MDVGAIVFTGSGAVEQLIVLFYQRNAPLGVLPDPVGKSILDDPLFLLRQHSLPLVQHTLGLALGILDRVIDLHHPGKAGEEVLSPKNVKNILRAVYDSSFSPIHRKG